MNYFVDRNCHVCFQIADELSAHMPSITKARLYALYAVGNAACR